MADFEKTYAELIKSNEELVKKFKAYTEASKYDGKQDSKKWLGELVKAMKEVEAALADTKAKLAAMEKAFEEYAKANKATIDTDKDAKGSLQKISDWMDEVAKYIKKVEIHLNKHKAEA